MDLAWRHVVINTRNTWLPGDPRGWRSRKHREHSSGDYRNPPPRGEHTGLHDYCEERSGEPVMIPLHLREIVSKTLVEHLTDAGHRIIAVAVGATHAHLLVELPDDMPAIKAIIGRAKSLASRKIRKELPGRVWADGGTFKRISNRAHHVRVFQYILGHDRDGAWVWSFRDT